MHMRSKCTVVGHLLAAAADVCQCCYNTTATVCAVCQVLDKRRRGHGQDQLNNSLRREVAAMKMLRHKNIVTLWEVGLCLHVLSIELQSVITQ
jgi:hypothetical protein